MTLSETTSGVYVISATPFFENGEIDYASADTLVEFYLSKGVSGLTILGMMGEATKLSFEEASTFADYMLKRVNGRVPVVVGVSAAGTGMLAALSRDAMDKGAAGVMIAPPKGIATDDAHYAYYEQCLTALGPDIPVCHQDFPLSTGVHLSASLFTKMVKDFDQLVMLKHEDWPGLNKLSAVRRLAQEQGARRVSILCGNGGVFLPEEMQRGADGAMTGFAYPEMLATVVDLCNAGDNDRASDIFDAFLPIIRLEQQPGAGLAIRKEILRRRGALTCNAPRLPGPKISAQDMDEITRLTERLNRRLQELEVTEFTI